MIKININNYCDISHFRLHVIAVDMFVVSYSSFLLLFFASEGFLTSPPFTHISPSSVWFKLRSFNRHSLQSCTSIITTKTKTKTDNNKKTTN